VLALLPAIPDAAVRYRRAAGPTPTSRGRAAAELAGRLEELERYLWRTAAGRAPDPADSGFRRAYGFFDAADQLGSRALRGAA
jgi:hypothetical protein